MAYVKPIIRVRENNRYIDRGCFFDNQIGRHCLQATKDETFKVNLDYTDILDGATITAATASDGLTASSAVVAGVVTLTLSAVTCAGDLDVTTTFSDGRIRQDFLRVYDPFASFRDDYGPVRAQA
jgi:hypothetical protein